MEPKSTSDIQKSKPLPFIISFALLIILIPAALFFYKQQTLKQLPVNNSPLKTSFTCPVAKDFCLKGKSITVTPSKPLFSALAYEQLASDSAVLAIIPGEYTAGGSVGENGERTTFLSIENEELNIQADYEFKGQAYIPSGVGNGQVKQGDAIGWVNQELLDKNLFDKQYQLIVSVRELKTKEYINLNQELSKAAP